ncbi:MAG: response regulator [Candidatus Accumulibacter sp.]|jgi:putative two-component system response regulator|nr:response regulator [Accumulibacter sp.]
MDNTRKLILLVDDNATNLLVGKSALSDKYRVLTASSAQNMLEALNWSQPELILLDVDMPDMDGFAAIRILKERPETREIPVIFLTAMNDSDNELRGLQSGAVDYITKPFSPPLLRKRVELHLILEERERELLASNQLLEEQKSELRNYSDNLEKMVEAKTRTVLNLQNKLLTAMAEMVEGRDGATGDHIAHTRKFLSILMSAVKDAGLWKEQAAQWDVGLLAQSSQLHDVGKIAIRDSILKKPGKLTPEEYAEMKQHVAYGVRFIEGLEDGDEDSQFLRYAKIFIAFHHEKWDGSGYPYGLAGEDIPLLGRMMAVVDVYDALTSERPYKKAFGHEEAVRIIAEGSGTHFDPALAALFGQVAEKFRLAKNGNETPKGETP